MSSPEFSRTGITERLDQIITALGGLMSGSNFHIHDVDLTTLQTDVLLNISGKGIILLSTPTNVTWSFKLVQNSVDSEVVSRIDMQNFPDGSLNSPFDNIKFTNTAASGKHVKFLVYS